MEVVMTVLDKAMEVKLDRKRFAFFPSSLNSTKAWGEQDRGNYPYEKCWVTHVQGIFPCLIYSMRTVTFYDIQHTKHCILT